VLGLDRHTGVVERGYHNVVADTHDTGQQILVGDRIKEKLDRDTRTKSRIRASKLLQIAHGLAHLVTVQLESQAAFPSIKLVELKVLIAASAKLLCVWRPC